jgi:hypothetical protein
VAVGKAEETPSYYITTYVWDVYMLNLRIPHPRTHLLLSSIPLTSPLPIPPHPSTHSTRPSSPLNQLANCCPLTLGARLSLLAAPLLPCSGGVPGLLDPGFRTGLPLARLSGVGLRLSISLFLARRLREDDFCMRRRQLERLDEEAVSAVLLGVVLLSL